MSGEPGEIETFDIEDIDNKQTILNNINTLLRIMKQEE